MSFYNASPELVDNIPPAAAPAAPYVAPALELDAPPAASDPATADALYAPVEVKLTPDAVREWRSQHDDPAAQFFSNTADPTIEASIAEAFREGPDTDTKVHTAHVSAMSLELTAIARDVGFVGAEAIGEFGTAAREMARLDEAGMASMEAEARARLVREHGAEGAEKALEAARALVSRDQRVAQILNQTRTGSHPAVVARLAREAMKQRAAGKLKA
jgi:hypothetical protein